MNSEKNINIMLKQPEENNENFISISAVAILKNLKRFFLLWFIASVVLAMTASGVAIQLKTSISFNTITALVNFNYSGIEKGLAPDGRKFDVNKIKSPSVIEESLTELDLPLYHVEEIRRNISIKGISSKESTDKKTLYQNIYSKGAGNALSAVESLLSIQDTPMHYIIELNYGSTSLDLTTSKQFLDALLKNYQEYFFITYGYNESLGNSIVSIDYKEYDYPTAIDVFEDTLTNLSDYVRKLSLETPKFRSGKTGYSFDDLLSTIETIRVTELDSIASYVEINNVTNDEEHLLNYYQYKIEQLERNKNVLQSEFDTISNSIEKYEKDSMIIIGEGTESLNDASYTLPSEKYDELIRQKIEKQISLSRCNENIEYFNRRITAMSQNKNQSSDANKKEAETRLANVNDKIKNLIDIVNRTADEYYATVTFAHAYNILVPATGNSPQVVTKDIMVPVIISEAVLFIVYITIAFIISIVDENKLKKAQESEKKDKDEE